MSLRRAALLIGAFALLLSACSGSPATDPTSAPRFVTQPTTIPTPLAVAVEASTTPKATPKPNVTPKPTPKPTIKPKATPKPTSFYEPPGWDGYTDVNCSDFDTHAHAQSFFKGTGGSKTNDPYRLDGDHDGIACETLP